MVLGVPCTASHHEVHEAYLRAVACVIDAGGDGRCPDLSAVVTLQQLADARAVVGDVAARAAYDTAVLQAVHRSRPGGVHVALQWGLPCRACDDCVRGRRDDARAARKEAVHLRFAAERMGGVGRAAPVVGRRSRVLSTASRDRTPKRVQLAPLRRAATLGQSSSGRR